jgi:hypothetical protein
MFPSFSVKIYFSVEIYSKNIFALVSVADPGLFYHLDPGGMNFFPDPE